MGGPFFLKVPPEHPRDGETWVFLQLFFGAQGWKEGGYYLSHSGQHTGECLFNTEPLGKRGADLARQPHRSPPGLAGS